MSPNVFRQVCANNRAGCWVQKGVSVSAVYLSAEIDSKQIEIGNRAKDQDRA